MFRPHGIIIGKLKFIEKSSKPQFNKMLFQFTTLRSNCVSSKTFNNFLTNQTILYVFSSFVFGFFRISFSTLSLKTNWKQLNLIEISIINNVLRNPIVFETLWEQEKRSFYWAILLYIELRGTTTIVRSQEINWLDGWAWRKEHILKILPIFNNNNKNI